MSRQTKLSFTRVVTLSDGRSIRAEPLHAQCQGFPFSCTTCSCEFKTKQGLVGHRSSKSHQWKEKGQEGGTPLSSAPALPPQQASLRLALCSAAKSLPAGSLVPSMVANYVELYLSGPPSQDDSDRKCAAAEASPWLGKKRKLLKEEKQTAGASCRKHRDPMFKRFILLQIDEAKRVGVQKPYEAIAQRNKLPIGNMSRWLYLFFLRIRVSSSLSPSKS